MSSSSYRVLAEITGLMLFDPKLANLFNTFVKIFADYSGAQSSV